MSLKPRTSSASPMSPTVKVLGFVSLLNDVASEATLRLLPLFLSQVPGASGRRRACAHPDVVSADQGRKLAYGLFNFVVGLMCFPVSLLFGLAVQW